MIFQVPEVTDCFKDIFNTDSSGDEREEIPRCRSTSTITTPASVTTSATTTDPFSLHLPYLSTPRHDFARQYSVTSSPSDFDRFGEEAPFPSLGSLDLGSLVSSPVKGNSVAETTKSPVNLDSLLTLDISLSDDQFNDMLSETVDYLQPEFEAPLAPSKSAEIPSTKLASSVTETSVIPSTNHRSTTMHPANDKSVVVSSANAKSVISPSPTHKTSPVPSINPPSVKTVTSDLYKQHRTPSSMTQPQSNIGIRNHGKSSLIIKNKSFLKSNRANQPSSQIPQRTYSHSNPSNEHTPIKKLDLKTASSKDIVEALNDLITANENKVAYSKTARTSGYDDIRRRRNRAKYVTGSVATKADYNQPPTIKPKPKSPSQLREEMGVNIIKQKVFRDLRGNKKVIAQSSTPRTSTSTGKPPPRATAAVLISSSETSSQNAQGTTLPATAKLIPNKSNLQNMSPKAVSSNPAGKLNQNALPKSSSLAPNYPTHETKKVNQNNLVPYTKPASSTTGNKKYLLLPVDSLQHMSPDALQKLGLQPSVLEKLKRTVDPPSMIGTKRQKTDTMIDSATPSFTERTQFPINIKLPGNMKDKFNAFPKSIPDMMQKAKEKRKHQRSNISAFGQMEAYISEFIKQNNEQVMEILFLKQNNRELNEKFNNLSKVFHLKTLEQKKLREEVDSLKIQNKKLEKEIRLMRDLIKKYIQ